jgi:hypothetical protein
MKRMGAENFMIIAAVPYHPSKHLIPTRDLGYVWDIAITSLCNKCPS